MFVGSAGPGWEWPKAVGFSMIFYEHQMFIALISGPVAGSLRFALKTASRNERCFRPPMGARMKAAPFGCGFFTYHNSTNKARNVIAGENIESL